jgi:ATP-dependent helicase/nuclease subunit A
VSALTDAPARADAIHPLGSFCVSAPAGSGKTELLIQRYLGLLSRVSRPEQVLAITFTRKAAAEMRERVVQALHDARANTPCTSSHEQVTQALAKSALAADTQNDWGLLRDVSRFNIRTIDSFCAALARQMPVLSLVGGQAHAQDDVAPLYAEAVLELYALLDEAHTVAADLEALLLHFDNNWGRVQELLMAMLACREQWQPYVGIHHAPAESEAYLIATVEALVQDALRQAARLLAPYAPQLLELLQYAAENLSREIPTRLPGNSSLELPDWYRLLDLLLTDRGEWRKSLTKNIGFPGGEGEARQRKDEWRELMLHLRPINELRERLLAIRSLPANRTDSESWQMAVHLSRLLPILAAQLLLVFRKHGVVDHSQVAQSAVLALGDDDSPTEMSLRMDYQIEHILVDEFQDTAITQYELLRKLTRGWGEHNHLHPQSPRTLMIVGDGMQSIYGFRGANVGLFLRAQLDGFNGVALQHLELNCNFRSDAGVVEWVNRTFERAFPAQDDACRSQISYRAATAIRPAGSDEAVEAHAFVGNAARGQEILFVCEAIAQGLRESVGTIAVLGRNRSHLQPIIRHLRQLQIPCYAPELDSLAQSPVVGDLLTLCRALADDYDRLAWAGMLRAPWCGLELADLLLIVGEPHDTPVYINLQNATVNQRLSADGRRRVQHILSALRWAKKKRDRLAMRVWIEQTWLHLHGPASTANREGLRDAESFLQLLEEAEAAGVGFDLKWLSTQVRKRFMATGDPDCRVQLLTLHKAKGLEFDHVIIPQLDRLPRQDNRELLLWDEHSNAAGQRAFLLAADDHSPPRAATLYNYLRLQRRRKTLLENTRLLYVGTTRAISRLLLTASVTRDAGAQHFRAPPEHSLLRCIWPAFEAQMQLHSSRTADESGGLPRAFPPLTRLRRTADESAAMSAAIPSIPTAGKVSRVEYDHSQRSIGTVVHQALEQLSSRVILPESISTEDKRRWRVALRRLGVCGPSLDNALQQVCASIMQCLRPDGSGRWVLAAGHAAAHSEWALTTVDESGQIRDITIDRSFIDVVSGERWVIDYKTSHPAPGEALDSFTAGQRAAHIDQLRYYRDAVRAVEAAPIRCALFFTALGLLHTIPELDLPESEAAAKP